MSRRTALVLRALHLGDLVTGLPALAMLRAGLPDHRIVLAAPAGTGQLALDAGLADALTAAWELAPLTAAPRGADLAVDLHGNGPASRDLLAATGPRRLYAYASATADWSDDEHEVARWCRLAAAVVPGGGHDTAAVVPGGHDTAAVVGGVPPWPSVSGLLPAEPSNGLTVIHPGAAAAARRWPADRYVAVADALARAGHDVVVTGGPGEQSLARAVADRAGVRPLTDLDLAGLRAAVGGARLLICGDTGPAHLASAYRTPSVLLFGPVSPARWGPPADGPHRVLWPAPADYRGDPHGRTPDPVLLAIGVDDVLAGCELAAAA